MTGHLIESLGLSFGCSRAVRFIHDSVGMCASVASDIRYGGKRITLMNRVASQILADGLPGTSDRMQRMPHRTRAPLRPVFAIIPVLLIALAWPQDGGQMISVGSGFSTIPGDLYRTDREKTFGSDSVEREGSRRPHCFRRREFSLIGRDDRFRLRRRPNQI
jgi:hypothetical protein